MRISTDLWFEKASTKAEAVVQDPEDRKLLNPETYDLIHAVDYPHMAASGIYGDYVEIEAFQQLGDRFLMAWELIKTMESNNLETPDSSTRDCDTCRHWGGWSKNCGFCHNRSKWEGRSAPEPRPAEEPAPAPSEEDCPCGKFYKCKAAPGGCEGCQEFKEYELKPYRTEIATLRSQLARKDEGLRKALERVMDHAEDWHEHYCELWGDRRKEQQDAILGDILFARAALREPVGRKGE